MRRIMLFASEIAAIAGRHPYKPRREALLGLLKRSAPEIYAERNFESTDDVAEKILEKSQDLQKHLENVKASIADPTDVSSALKAAKELVPTNVSPTEARVVAEKIRSTVFTSLGTNCESNVYAKLSGLIGTDVQKTDKLLKKQLGVLPKSGIAVWVCGRLDALGVDGRVIEIKNRVRRLFGQVPEYERIQVLTYLFLTDAKEAVLVEAFKDQYGTYDIPWDSGAWTDIQNDLFSGIDNFLTTEV